MIYHYSDDEQCWGGGVLEYALAVEKCYNYTSNSTDDWFLPSREELIAMYEHKQILGLVGQGRFWSSSQANLDEEAWIVDFDATNVFNASLSFLKTVH